MTRIEVRICGLGGQGVVLAGQILGRASVFDGKKVVQTLIKVKPSDWQANAQF